MAKTSALTKLIEILEPLAADERVRTIKAALFFLDTTAHGSLSEFTRDTSNRPEDSTNVAGAATQRAQSWLRQHSLTLDELSEVFHGDDGHYDVIVSELPAREMVQKALQTYLLCGIKSLLETGQPSIADKDARAVCRDLGFYDSTNHTKAYKTFGNMITGSKASGFQLTNPGLRAAAVLVRELIGKDSQ